MSFCRWSSNNWRCDLYAYEDCVGGYTMHVARSRHDPPPSTLLDQSSVEALRDSYCAQMEEVRTASLVVIGLPHDGETFRFETAREMLNKARELQAMGYLVPDSALAGMELEALDEERGRE